MKLQKKFILSMGLSALVPVLVISFLTYFTIKDYIIEIEGQRLKNVSLTALNTIEDQISSKINEVAVFAAIDTIVSSLDYEIYEQAHDLMASFVQNYQGYHEVRLVNLSGMVVSSSDQSHIGERHPAGAEANTVSMPYFNSKDKKFLINISIPVYLGSKRLGMLVAAYDIADVYGKVDWIEVSRSGDKMLGHIMVFDSTGRVFYAPQFERESIENILDENMADKSLVSVKESLAGKSGHVIESAEHEFKAIIGYGSSERLLQLKAIALIDLNSVLSQINTLMIKIFVFAIIFTLLGGTIAVLISRGFIRPLEQVVQRLDDIAEGEGDLTVRIDVSTSDEVGDLATGFNSFAEKIRDLVTRIAVTSGKIKDSSGRNVTIGEQLSVGANEQATKITSATAAVNEMSSTIINIAQNASTAADAAKEVSDKVDEGNQVVELTADGMRKIAEQVRSTAEGMNLLGRKVKEIGTIVSVIDEIADQTNLLALNAAIEAARAGEQGRGFAVVADEVRKLAERTTRSTSEIVQMITSIQQESEKSVSSMDMVVNEVDSGLSLVEKSRQALDIIVTASKKGLDMASMIATASEQQSASTEDISLSLEAVNTVSVETASLAKQMEESSEGLLKLADELDGIVGSFKTSSE